jgi:DNA-binding NarL/FixJ family response regulator
VTNNGTARKRNRNGPVRVLVVDDHPVVREGTTALLSRRPGLEVVGAASDGASGLRLVEQLRPDVLLLDLDLPDVNGVEVAQSVRTRWPDVAVLVITGYDVQRYTQLLTQLGVSGLIHKTASRDELFGAIQAAAEGGKLARPNRGRPGEFKLEALTVREHEVLGLMAAGLRNAEIAADLSVSLNTVEFHVRHILDKLGARSRTEAVLRARALGYVVPEDVVARDL